MFKLHSVLKNALVISAISLGISSSSGAPVNQSVALQEAEDFLASSPVGIRRAPAIGGMALSEAYTSKSGSTPLYYVFNSDSGFVIVSADDRLPAILGYSDSGKFDVDKLPINFKSWLEGYDKEIKRFVASAPESGEGRRQEIRRVKRESISPLLTTKWDQGSPYNLLCPTDANGSRCVTGCVATAYAQIMKYHNWPRNPEGTVGDIDLSKTTYNWRQMIDDYSDGNYTASQAQAVATLMHECGVAVNMRYSAWASGAYDYSVQYAMPVYFKYSPDLQILYKDYIPQREWSQMIYDELQASRPVFYTGSSSEGGHAFVCDGYSENDYFHFNWGWGGYEDGYFLLTALNPASGGAGSYEAGYTSHQSIIIGIKPGTDSQLPTQGALLSSGGFYHMSGNTYEIQQDPNSSNLIYNPLGYTQTVQFAIKIVSVNNPEFSPVYVNCGSPDKIRPYYGTGSITSSNIPTLPAGEYNITPVFQKDDDPEWLPVQIPIGMQNYVRLTVDENGSKSFTNQGPDKANVAKLLFGTPETLDVNYGELPIAMRIPVVNVGDGDFSSEIGFALTQLDTDNPDSSSIMPTFSIPGKTSQNLDVTFNDRLKPGRYQLGIMDMDGNIYSDDYVIEVKSGTFTTTAENDVVVFDLTPNFMTAGKKSPMYFSVKNNSILAVDLEFTFKVMDADTMEEVLLYPSGRSVTVPSRYQGRVNVAPLDLGLDPGEYYISIVDKAGTTLSLPTPLIVNSEVRTSDGISYVVTSEKNHEALIVAPEGDPYTGNIVLPNEIAGYKVKGMRNNAFTFAMTSRVTIPDNISALDKGTFYCDDTLRNLFFETETPMGYKDDIFNSKNYRYIWMNVPNDVANEWLSRTGWSRFNTPFWRITTNDVAVTGLEIDPMTQQPYSPYRINYLTPLTLNFLPNPGYNVDVITIINGEWVWNRVESGTSYDVPAIGLQTIGEIRLQYTTGQVGIDELYMDSAGFPIYSIDGRIVTTNATPELLRHLPAGIYISRGRKIVVK